MASGRLPNSSMGILGSAQMKEMIAELKQRYDFIFFDSPPILGVSDASILASEVDLVMQVIQYRRYPQPMTIRAKQMIEKVGGNFVGIVLNNINMSQDEGYYYYSGYYHDYYYSRSANEQEAEAKAKDRRRPGQAASASNKNIDWRVKFASITAHEFEFFPKLSSPFGLCFLPLLSLLFSGCASTTTKYASPHSDPTTFVSHLHIGDTVTVTLGGLPTPIDSACGSHQG